jgi:hypothetical protein
VDAGQQAVGDLHEPNRSHHTPLVAVTLFSGPGILASSGTSW